MNKFIPVLALFALGASAQAAQLELYGKVSGPTDKFITGGTFSVNIFASTDASVTEFVGGNLLINYNTNLLTATAANVATKDTDPQGPWEDGFSSTNINPDMSIDMAFGAFAAPPGNTEVLVGTIDFITEEVGESFLQFSGSLGQGQSFVALDISGEATFLTGVTFDSDMNQQLGTEAVVLPPTTVIPIPAAIWLFGSAVFGLGMVGNKRKQHQA